MEIPEINNSHIFRLYTSLSSMMKSHTILLCLAQDMNPHFVQSIHTVYIAQPLVT